jgi:hypothetical protein
VKHIIIPLLQQRMDKCTTERFFLRNFVFSGSGAGGGNVEFFGTVTAALQLGHGAVTPIWARVAKMCRPHLGHANLRSIASISGLFRELLHSRGHAVKNEICCEIVAKSRDALDLRERSLRGSNPK